MKIRGKCHTKDGGWFAQIWTEEGTKAGGIEVAIDIVGGQEIKITHTAGTARIYRHTRNHLRNYQIYDLVRAIIPTTTTDRKKIKPCSHPSS